MASDTQSGAIGPIPRIGKTSPAQDTSLDGSRNVSAPENAMEKNSAVSIELPMMVKQLCRQERKARADCNAKSHDWPKFAYDLCAHK